MIDIDVALAKIVQHQPSPRTMEVSLEDAWGLTLAADVVSDIDSPPHKKSLVDGYAVTCADFESDPVLLRVLEEVSAGEVPRHRLTSGWATRIMTGAPVPEGADAIVMREQIELLSDRSPTPQSTLGSPQIRVPCSAVKRGQFILPQAACLRKGERVLARGHTLRAVDLGLLAECGAIRPLVYRRPRVASFQTGDELVPASQQPATGQIRNSNGPLIQALIRQCGGIGIDLGVARDDPQELGRLIAQGLEADLLVLSGGVSVGDRDLVPAALTEAGVREVFHRVRLRPGKPIWFGIAQTGTLVFGLPGNPVSSLACFLLFVAPVVAHCAGRPLARRWPPDPTAVLAKEHELRDPRPTLWPAIRQAEQGQLRVTPLPWRGSADLRTLGQANCFVYFAEGNRTFAAGEHVPLLELE